MSDDALKELTAEGAIALMRQMESRVKLLDIGTTAFQCETLGPQQIESRPTRERNTILTRQDLTHNGPVTAIQTGFSVLHVGDPKEAGVLVRAMFRTAFAFDGDVVDDRRVAWAKIQGILTQWPYWREFHQSALSRIEATGPSMGIINLAIAANMAGYKRLAEATEGNTSEKDVPND